MKNKIVFIPALLIAGLLFTEVFGRGLLYVINTFTKPHKHAAVINEEGYVRLKPNFSNWNKKTGERFSTNSLGFRGREINEERSRNKIRIVALGGSTTFGVGASDNDQTYPALLENFLNRDKDSSQFKDHDFEVINGGIPGALSINLLNFFSERVLPQNPDVLIVYSGWNDWNHFFGEGRLIFEYRSFAYRIHGWFTGHSVLYSKLRNVFTGYRARIQGGEYSKRARNVLDQRYFVKSLEDNLGQLLNLCRERKIQAFLLWHPPPLSYFRIQDEKKYLEKDPVFLESLEMMLRVHQTLKKTGRTIAEKKQVPLINIDYLFDPGEFGDPLFMDIIHFSDAGNARIAKGVSDWLLKFGAMGKFR